MLQIDSNKSWVNPVRTAGLFFGDKSAYNMWFILSPKRDCGNRKVKQTPPPPSLLHIGWVGVGWQRHCKTLCSLRELGNQGTSSFFSFFRRAVTTGCRVRLFVRCGRPLTLTQMGMIVSRSVQGKAPKSQLHGTLIALSAYTGNCF